MNVVPYVEDFERAVIVASLQDPLLIPKLTNLVSSADFYRHFHREIWEVIASSDPENVDSLAVQDGLKEETKVYFKELVADSDKILPSSSNSLYYAEVIKQKSKLRAGIDLGQRIIAKCYEQSDADEAIQELEDMFASFLQKRVLEEKSETTQESFKRFLETLSARTPDDPKAIKTGFRDIDLMIQKLEGLVILAARPSMGKTALAINIISNVAHTKPVLFFSLEQSEEQIFERLLASEGGVNLEEIRMGIAEDSAISTAEKKINPIVQNVHIDDKANVPTSYITSLARQKKYEWGEIGLIVVDYLHIMDLGKKDKIDALGDATKELRGLGKELGCPVLLLAQLSRATEGRDNKKNRRPELSDLRSSGEIEQNADIVMFIYRESYYDMAGLTPDEDVAEIIVRKNRNGRQGIVLLDWLPRIVRFKDMNRR